MYTKQVLLLPELGETEDFKTNMHSVPQGYIALLHKQDPDQH